MINLQSYPSNSLLQRLIVLSRYMLQPSTSSSGEYLLTFEAPRYKTDQHHYIVKTPDPSQSRQNQSSQKSKKAPDNHSYGGHLCNPCMQSSNNGDNTSLDAYDLASPCCDPHCVPTSRRRSRNHKEHRKRDSKTEETQTEPQPHVRSLSQSSQTQTSAPRRYFQLGAGLVSHCSLHSCTSSELSAVAPTTMGESSASYTTSLSTDTLYWDGSCDTNSRQMSIKSSGKHEPQYVQIQQGQDPNYIQFNPVKPKSWDNLATKAFGGYGFGYGYLDTTISKCGIKSHSKSTKCNRSNTERHTNSERHANSERHTNSERHMNNERHINSERHTPSSSCSPNQPVYTPHAQRRYFQPTKSTESLLSVPKHSNEALSDSSTSCECLESVSPGHESRETHFFQSPRQSVASPTDPNFGYYSARKPPKGEYGRANSVTTSSEATRL